MGKCILQDIETCVWEEVSFRGWEKIQNHPGDTMPQEAPDVFTYNQTHTKTNSAEDFLLPIKTGTISSQQQHS